MKKVLPLSFYNTITYTGKVKKKPFLSPSLAFIIILIGSLLACNNAKAQIINESFEETLWSTGTHTSATTSGQVVVTQTSASISLTLMTANNTSSTISTTNTSPNSGTWIYSKGTVTVNTAAYHSQTNAWSMPSSGGYIITPVITNGVASIKFWAGSGSTSTPTFFVGINSNASALTATAATAFGSLASTGFTSFVSQGFTLPNSKMVSNGEFTVTNTVSFTGPCRVGFFSNAATGIRIDDIIITQACNPPVVSFTGIVDTATAGANVTYTTQVGQSNYLWTFPGSVLNTDYTISSGGTTGSNFVTVSWITTGNKTVAVNYTNAGGCAAAAPTTTATNVNTNLTPPTLTAAVGATVDAPFNITFTDNPTWRGVITGVTINGTALPGGAYSFSAGVLTLTPSASALLQTAGTVVVRVFATGYNSTAVNQPIAAGVAAQLAVSTQPTAPANNGAALGTQPVVNIKDQYGNNVNSGATIVATTSGGTWVMGGTTSVAATSGVATFAGLTAGTAGGTLLAGATITFTLGAFNVVSSSFTIPAYATTATDYFKSNGTGDWANAGTWLSSADNINFYAASAAPTSSSSGVTILNTHTVTINSATASVGNCSINTGGRIYLNNNAASTLTVASGKILTVNGTLENGNSTTNPAVIATGSIVVNSGAYYILSGSPGAIQIPAATWDPNSTVQISGGYSGATNLSTIGGSVYGHILIDGDITGTVVLFTPGTYQRIAGNLTLSYTNTGIVQLLSSSGTNILSIDGNYTQTSGIALMNPSGAGAFRPMVVKGNFSIDGCTFRLSSSTAENYLVLKRNFSANNAILENTAGTAGGNSNVIFADSVTTQTYTWTGTRTIQSTTNKINFIVNSGASLDMGSTNILDGTNTTFTVSGAFTAPAYTGTWSSGANTINPVVGSLTGVQPGMLVTGPGIQPNTYVTAVLTASSLQISKATTAAGAAGTPFIISSASAGTLKTAHSSGVNGSIAMTGLRTLNSGANIIYNSAAGGNQSTGFMGIVANVPGSITALTTNNTNVNLDTSITLGATGSNPALTLNTTGGGVFSIGANTLGFQNTDVPVLKTSGTITTATTSSLVFGTAGNIAGAAFTLPSGLFTSSPVITNLSVNRTNLLTLNSQGMELSGALTLTAGTLNIGAGSLLKLNGASLSAPAGFLAGTATSDLTVTGSSGGTVNLPLAAAIDLRTVIISGSRTVVMDGTHDIKINSGGSFTLGSSAVYDNGGQSQLTKPGIGQLSPTFLISGKFITRATGGFLGGNSSISSSYASADINLNSGSTVEYGLSGNQTVQGGAIPSYFNVIFSGSGTKDLQSTNPCTGGLITCSGSAIVNVHNFTFGSGATGLTMTGTSKYMNSGSGTKPDVTPPYTLSTGSTIEFDSTTATVVRLTPTYANVIINGTNVSNTSLTTPITLQATCSFTVNTGATFKLASTAGFSGASNTAVSSTNSPTINLQTGSTIDYTGTTQAITNTVPYQNLNLGGSLNKTAPAGVLTVQGDLTSSGGVFVHNNGTVLLNGTTQAFAGFTYNNLAIDNAGTKTLAASASIIDSIKLGNTTTNPATVLSLGNNNITLLSTATQTSRVATVGSNASVTYGGTGRFIVQRYYPSRRAWRLTTAPVWGTGSIYTNWQNAGVYTAGIGTLVTGANPTGGSGNGLDASTQNNPSLKTYNITTQAYDPVTNTITSNLSNSSGSADNIGYFFFVRGDRDPANTSISNSNITTISSTGKIQTGTQTFSGSSTSGSFAVVGNPYASPIDFNNVTRNNLIKRFYVWDPYLNTAQGGYVVVEDLANTGTFTVTPPSPGGQNKFIESGQAFFIQTNAAGASSIVFNESAKSATNNLGIFRPMSPSALPESFRTNLYLLNPDNTTILADGTLVEFDNSYNAGVDLMDATKFSNITETISLLRNGETLSVERRPVINVNDTLFLKLTKTNQRSYRLEFVASQMDHPGMAAYLEDNFLHTSTPLGLNTTTQFDFTVTADPLSSASDRFRVVFNPSVVVPVTIRTIQAWKQGNDVQVEWKVENQLNIVQYEVERSADGRTFSHMNTIPAVNNGGSFTYDWLDRQPLAADNFYRIRVVDRSGAISYSSIVKVSFTKGAASFVVSPNPVKDNKVAIQLNNVPAGIYIVRLLNNLGQQVLSQKISHTAGSSVESIQLDHMIVPGVYQLEVGKEGVADRPQLIKVFIQ